MKISELFAVKRTARGVRKLTVLMRLALALALVCAVLAMVTYVFAYYFNKYGAFTINVDKQQMLELGMSLSEDGMFDRPISQLHAAAIERIDNISGDTIPANIYMLDGENNGKNYIAYTYYFKNTGDAVINYTATVTIESATLGIDHAIRFKLYENGTPTVYAKEKDDGSGPEEGTTAFLSERVVTRKETQNYLPGQVTKYTVVLWLEGNDAECVNEIMGGVLKMQMSFDGVKAGVTE